MWATSILIPARARRRLPPATPAAIDRRAQGPKRRLVAERGEAAERLHRGRPLIGKRRFRGGRVGRQQAPWRPSCFLSHGANTEFPVSGASKDPGAAPS